MAPWQEEEGCVTSASSSVPSPFTSAPDSTVVPPAAHCSPGSTSLQRNRTLAWASSGATGALPATSGSEPEPHATASTPRTHPQLRTQLGILHPPLRLPPRAAH